MTATTDFALLINVYRVFMMAMGIVATFEAGHIGKVPSCLVLKERLTGASCSALEGRFRLTGAAEVRS